MPSINLMPTVGIGVKDAPSGPLFRIQTLHKTLGPIGRQGTQFVHI
ncbi:hypothetical protein [Pseudomonas sp. LB3P25]